MPHPYQQLLPRFVAVKLSFRFRVVERSRQTRAPDTTGMLRNPNGGKELTLASVNIGHSARNASPEQNEIGSSGDRDKQE